MFFDPNTSFVQKDQSKQAAQTNPPRVNLQQSASPQASQLYPNQNAQQQYQQPQQQANNIQPTEINQRILRMRLEDEEEEREQGWLQNRIDEISGMKRQLSAAEKEVEYLEKMKKNPFIKQKFLSNMDPENMKMFVLFNTKQNLDYKLKYYLYQSSQANVDIKLDFYNRLHLSKKQVNLNKYISFNDKEPDYVLINRSNLNTFYGQLHQNVISSESPNIIQSQPYRGFYSKQYDYQFFQMQAQSEKSSYPD